MWMDADDARSDFVLAAAAALFGPLLFQFLFQLLPVARLGAIGLLLYLVQVFAVTGLVPLLLARYREQGRAAFGLDAAPGGFTAGVVVCAPIVAAGTLHRWGSGWSPGRAALGWLAPVAAEGPVQFALGVAVLGVLIVGQLLLFTFLVTRARDGFRRNEVTQLEALRTFGLGAVAAAVAVGLFASVRPQVTLTRVVLEAAALVALVLFADRLVDSGATTSRATILAPAIVAVVLRIVLFTRDLLPTLHQGLVAGAVVVVVATLVETRRHAWAAVPVVAAATLYEFGLLPRLLA